MGDTLEPSRLTIDDFGIARTETTPTFADCDFA